MEELLLEFKQDIEDYANEKLSQLDTKIERVEHELTSLDYKEELFKLEKQLSKLERNIYGYDFSTHNDGDN